LFSDFCRVPNIRGMGRSHGPKYLQAKLELIVHLQFGETLHGFAGRVR
jgi:hypothetical protein